MGRYSEIRTTSNNEQSITYNRNNINKNNDVSIMATAEDALLWKQRTHTKGYYNDPYLEYLSNTSFNNRRDSYGGNQQPIMRRGTYSRVCCMDRAISQFVSKGGKQVVVLGAGKDTSCMRMRRNMLTTKIDSGIDLAGVLWCDVDLPKVIESKRMSLQQSFPEVSDDEKYVLKAWDLREEPEKFIKFLIEHGFDITAPILFIMECVLMYLPNNAANELLQCLSNQCSTLLLSIYDPIIMYDRFGKVMAQHLTNARIMDTSLSMNHTPTIQKHIQRLHSLGYATIIACDMLQAYDTVISSSQRCNANKIELLDELEEWRLIMSHYTFVIAVSVKDNRHLSFVKDYTSVGPDSPLGFMNDQCTYSNIN